MNKVSTTVSLSSSDTGALCSLSQLQFLYSSNVVSDLVTM